MLLDAIYKIHRWGGVAVAILMVTWLFSGLVILYTGQLPQTRTQSLAHQQTLAPEANWLGLGEAWQKSAPAHPGSVLASARLLRIADAPVWLVIDQSGKTLALSALDGTIQSFSLISAEDIAQQWLGAGQHGDDWAVTYLDTREAPSSLKNYWDIGPFRRVAINDADHTELLIAARTGEVVQATTRLDRTLYYAGSWLHFLRFLDTPTSGETRRNVLLWTGFIAALASLTGMIIGWIKWKPGFNGKPTYSQGRSQPYRSFFLKYHFWTGLIGGTFLSLWAVSGYLNGNPWQIFSTATAGKAELASYQGQADPGSWRPGDLAGSLSSDVVELDWQHLGDRSLVVAYKRDGSRWALPLAGNGAELDRPSVEAAVKRLGAGADIVDISLLKDYDSYYYLYHNRDAADKPLPVWRVQLADPGRTLAYVDPVDGRLLARLDASRRVYRWVFSAVHRWDLPGLYQRPIWDLWQLTWIGWGLALGLTSVVLAWRWLRRKAMIFSATLQVGKDQGDAAVETLSGK